MIGVLPEGRAFCFSSRAAFLAAYSIERRSPRSRVQRVHEVLDRDAGLLQHA